MADAMGDVFNLPVSTKFIEDNLTDLKKMVDGDVEAFERLQAAAAKDYVANLSINANTDRINEVRNELNAFIDEYSGRDIGFTASIDDSPFVQSLNKMIENGEAKVSNYYTSVVDSTKNEIVEAQFQKYYKKADVAWRGMGILPGTGLMLKEDYAQYDAGSAGLDVDNKKNIACRCGDILMGKAKPADCPLFGRVCTPSSPQGACMVSQEGSCNNAFLS